MTGRAVMAAYQDTGAANIPCPHCAAQPGRPCTKPDGRISKVPCVDRLTAADLTPTTSTTLAVGTHLRPDRLLRTPTHPWGDDPMTPHTASRGLGICVCHRGVGGRGAHRTARRFFWAWLIGAAAASTAGVDHQLQETT